MPALPARADSRILLRSGDASVDTRGRSYLGPIARRTYRRPTRGGHPLRGALLILAGPGSGKTRVVTHRVAWLLQQGVPGHQILALTFTNKAADEMSRRIERLANDPTVWVGTFHRFCARLLRKYASLVGLQENYTIYDTAIASAPSARPSAGSRSTSSAIRPKVWPKPSVGPRTP